MAGMSSLGIAISGMNAARQGLNVIGHNISNLESPGYVRQGIVQGEFLVNTIGRNGSGLMQLGLGTDVLAVRQIRDKFLDRSFRMEAPRFGFYNAKSEVGSQVLEIFGELEGEYKMGDVFDKLWKSLNNLSIDPVGLDTRGAFVSTLITFMDKINNTSARLAELQSNINNQVSEIVTRINQITTSIDNFNRKIAMEEAGGANANDYRDSRNMLLDELSLLIDIDCKELPDGSINVMTEGRELVVNGVVNRVGLRYSSENERFVEPVFTQSTAILPADPTNQNAYPMFNFNTDVNAAIGNDTGRLKGLLIARGSAPANYTHSPDALREIIAQKKAANLDYSAESKMLFNVTNCTIPKMQLELDTLVHSVVTLINDTFSPYIAGTPPTKDPNAPYGIDENQTQYMEIFVRANSGVDANGDPYSSRFNAAGELIEENPDDYYSLYSLGNIKLNEELYQTESYSKIPLSKTGDISDATIVLDLIEKWNSEFIAVGSGKPLGVNDFYKMIVLNVAVETNEADNYVDSQGLLLESIDGKRTQISGVSLDEEMRNMMVYQQSYNASSRILNVIDSMLDKIVNGTGRVGN